MADPEQPQQVVFPLEDEQKKHSTHDTSSMLTSLQSRVEDVEREAQLLSAVVEKVTASLAKRTTRSAHATVSHTASTSDIAQAAVDKLATLQQTINIFFSEIHNLKQHFELFKTLAVRTNQVKMQLIRLETQVTQLLLSKTS